MWGPSFLLKSFSGSKKVVDERDRALNAWFFVMGVAALYGPDGFDTAECRFWWFGVRGGSDGIQVAKNSAILGRCAEYYQNSGHSGG